ncbi:hypothetical protein [Pseudogemmobacter sonorensis]|uniref:hypothetical protein n=1 Tax=Pseudogemmobacter sonorensis TaxID=2989681 RepID=UPI0036D041BC
MARKATTKKTTATSDVTATPDVTGTGPVPEGLQQDIIQGENGAGKSADTPDASAEGHTAAQDGEAASLPVANTEGGVGAGQPADTPDAPSVEADLVGGAAGGGGDAASTALNTEGANDAGDTAEAPLRAPGGPDGSAPTQGGEAEILPATHEAGDEYHTYEGLERLAQVDAAGNVLSPAAGASAAGGPADLPGALRVICHVEGGRRRLDRRWPKGETPVPEDKLTDTDIALLEGDPRFTVIRPKT